MEFYATIDCHTLVQFIYVLFGSRQGPGAGAGARSRNAPEPCFPWNQSRGSKFSHATGLFFFLVFLILF